MSTSYNNVLWLRPYGEIEKHVTDCGVRVLPGRLAALTHPINKGRTILLPDKELYDPDVATVVSSGIQGFEKGEVVVLAPDHGAYYPRLSPDGRELRIVGVACPWWESVLAKLDANGLQPAPGWMLVDLEGAAPSAPGSVRSVRSFRTTAAIVLASHGDHHTEPHKGDRVCIAGMRHYRITPSSCGDESCAGGGRGRGTEVSAEPTCTNPNQTERTLALVRAPIASTTWLQSLRTQT